ncbi:MAG: response regulator [Planctomycetota bacterium]|jgi:DNA-binding NarL/FixJ family response regulator
MSIKVLLADDHDSFRDGLRELFEKEKDIEIVGQANDGQQAVKMAKELLPDIVIMDITMPNLNGIDATQQITEKLTQTKVLVLSATQDQHLAGKVLKAGAKGYVPKDAIYNELINAIHTVLKGKVYLSPSIIGQMYVSTRKNNNSHH